MRFYLATVLNVVLFMVCTVMHNYSFHEIFFQLGQYWGSYEASMYTVKACNFVIDV